MKMDEKVCVKKSQPLEISGTSILAFISLKEALLSDSQICGKLSQPRMEGMGGVDFLLGVKCNKVKQSQLKSPP